MNSDSIAVELANQQDRELEEDRLVALIRGVLAEHGYRSGEVSLAVVTDPVMRELNRQYLDHDYETDVLSFLLDVDPERDHLEGQLIVSADTAAREAAERDVPWHDELMLYVVHGTLHLVGMDDHSPADASAMRAAERAFLEPFGIIPCWEAEEGESA